MLLPQLYCRLSESYARSENVTYLGALQETERSLTAQPMSVGGNLVGPVTARSVFRVTPPRHHIR